MSETTNEFRDERIELGLSQQDAAMLLSVSRVTYIKWESQPELMPIGRFQQLKREFQRLRELKEQE